MNWPLIGFVACVVTITAVALIYALYRRPKVKLPQNDELLQSLTHTTLSQIKLLRTMQRILVVAMLATASLLSFQLLLPGTQGNSVFSSRDHIYIALDNSMSMNTTDFDNSGNTTRLDGAKQALGNILEQLPTAKVTLLTFHSQVLLHNYYSDAGSAKDSLQQVAPSLSFATDGTDFNKVYAWIGDDIKTLEQQGHHDKVSLLVLSDGEQTAGTFDTNSLSSLKAKVSSAVTVGVGSPAGGPVQAYDLNSNSFQPVNSVANNTAATSMLDEVNLQQQASTLGGQYQHITNSSDVKTVVDTLGVSGTASSATSTDATAQYYGLVSMLFFGLLCVYILLPFMFLKRTFRTQASEVHHE